MQINIPAVHAEIAAAFEQYVAALNSGDMDTVAALFWNSPHTLRYGPDENLYGIEAIRALRAAQRGRHLTLTVTRVVITSFGQDFGTANCEIERSDTARSGRMSHTWARLDGNWRIVAAHVSHGPGA